MNERAFSYLTPERAGPQGRQLTVPVKVGHVTVGGGAPIVVQSMTNTDTADIAATVAQVAALARQGSELVRITVDRDEAAAAVPRISIFSCAAVSDTTQARVTSLPVPAVVGRATSGIT